MIIGIDTYVNLEAQYQLRGCVNDARLVRHVLGEHFGFADADMVSLHNEEATRERILAEMERLVAVVGPDDVVTFHFSGHGSRRTSVSPEEGSGKDSTIMPQDSGRDPLPNLDIVDHEINAWLARLSAKTHALSLVFDCCHSGTITRDPFAAQARSAPDDLRSLADMGVDRDRLPIPVRFGSRDAGSSGNWLALSDAYVVMSGCRNNELAHEFIDEQAGATVRNGALTHFLVSAMVAAQPGTTYRDIFDSARIKVSTRFPDQHPLGTENENLPSYIAIPDPRGNPEAAGNTWSAAFLPAAYQGTAFNAENPIRFLARPDGISASTDRATADFLKRLNERHLEKFPGDCELAARIASYELAAKMQMTVPSLTDLSSEPAHVLKMYGADDPTNAVKAGYARNYILVRRLCVQGVRFVQVFNGAYAMGEGVGNWDGHKTIASQYPGHAEILDQPTAALFLDLKQRGLLADTLFVFCTEFGRMPTFQKGASGRDHNPSGFNCILAGAGVQTGAKHHGETDEFGWKAAVDVTSVYDFHATILHLLGLDHERLSYYHNGLERRLTDVHGHVIQSALA